jgi:hypothetical protein
VEINEWHGPQRQTNGALSVSAFDWHFIRFPPVVCYVFALQKRRNGSALEKHSTIAFP